MLYSEVPQGSLEGGDWSTWAPRLSCPLQPTNSSSSSSFELLLKNLFEKKFIG